MHRKTRLWIAIGLFAGLIALAGIVIVAGHDAASASGDNATGTTAETTASLGTYAEGVVTIELGETISVQGDGATVDGSTVTIGSAGVYRLSGTLADGRIVVDTKGKVYLELNGVDITSGTGPALLVENAKKATLILVEGTTNSFADAADDSSDYDAAIFSNDTLVIDGKGALVVTGNDNEGISGDDDLIVQAGTITVTAADDGLNAHDDITVTGGDLTIHAGGDALDSNGTMHLKGGNILAFGSTGSGDGGLDVRGDLIIKGGTVVGTGSSTALPAAKSTQASLYIATGSIQPAGTAIRITRDGAEVATITPDAAYVNVVFSSGQLDTGVTYEVYVGSSSRPVSVTAGLSSLVAEQ